MALTGTGVAFGVLAAAGAMWFLRGMLFGVVALDPVVFPPPRSDSCSWLSSRRLFLPAARCRSAW